MWKKLLIALVVVIALPALVLLGLWIFSSTQVGSYSLLKDGTGWITFHSAKYGFSADLPAFPVYSSKQTPSSSDENILHRTSVYQSSEESIGEFTISVSEPPSSKDQTYPYSSSYFSLYAQAVKKSFDDDNGEISTIKTDSLTLDNNPAIGFSLEYANERVEGALFIVNGNLYTLYFVQKDVPYNEQNFLKFLDSFQIL